MPKYKIEKINKTSAIYLYPMGEVEIVSFSLNSVVFYNMDAYFEMIFFFNEQRKCSIEQDETSVRKT